jgi:hypothetical protein
MNPSTGTEVLSRVFDSLRNDPGLQALLPYFAHFLPEQVKNNVRCLPELTNLIKACHCLLSNPHLHMELYVCLCNFIFVFLFLLALSATSFPSFPSHRYAVCPLLCEVCGRGLFHSVLFFLSFSCVTLL